MGSSQILLDMNNSPPHSLNTIPNPLNLPLDTLAALTCTVLGVMQQHNNNPTSNLRRKIVSEKIKAPVVQERGTRCKVLTVRQFFGHKAPMY